MPDGIGNEHRLDVDRRGTEVACRYEMAQFQFAREQGMRFWLYVVDKLDSGRPGLYVIQDPASKVSEYRFDDGWTQAAESAAAPERGPHMKAQSSAGGTAITGPEATAEAQN